VTVPDNKQTTSASRAKQLGEVLTRHRSEILDSWISGQLQVVGRGIISPASLKAESEEFLHLFIPAVTSQADINDHIWDQVRDSLNSISRSRAEQGFSPSETATFVFSLKGPLFDSISSDFKNDPEGMANLIWAATEALDPLGLYTTEVHQKRREEVIARQAQDMLELSTPVVTLWDGILALPMIGTLDSARTQVVMETLLQRIVETGASFAILDITGVPTVDTLTAQHLLKTVTAARLMGAECIISGIRPQIAQTVVHLGVDLGDILTKATLADAFRIALSRSGRQVVRVKSSATGKSWAE
jgi:rsbT co-antagonist protein RsbR